MCQKIPRLGGLAFYPAILIAYWVMRGLLSLFDSHLVGLPVEEMLFFFAGITIVYYIGIADDVIGLSYKSKFIYQFINLINEFIIFHHQIKQKVKFNFFKYYLIVSSRLTKYIFPPL